MSLRGSFHVTGTCSPATKSGFPLVLKKFCSITDFQLGNRSSCLTVPTHAGQQILLHLPSPTPAHLLSPSRPRTKQSVPSRPEPIILRMRSSPLRLVVPRS